VVAELNIVLEVIMVVFDWEITDKDVEGYDGDMSLPYKDPDIGAMVLKPGVGIGMIETEDELIRRGAVYTWEDAVALSKKPV
jgi:hypothetical protein